MRGLKREDKKIKIGILTHNYPKSSKESRDAGKFVYAFSHELAKEAKVSIFCPDYGDEKEKDSKVPVTWFNWGGNGQKFGNWNFYSPLSLFKFIRLFFFGNKEIVKFIEKEKPDYLLCFWNFPSGIFAWYANKKFGIKYSTWALGSDIYVYPKLPIVKEITQIVLKNAEYRFGNSYDICKAIKNLSGKSAEFLPTSTLISGSKYKKPNLDRKKYNFLCIARLEKVKGIDVLLDACKTLKNKTDKFSLTIIGGGTLREYLSNKIIEYKLDNNVNMLGYVEDQGLVNGYLKESDCLIIPSRSESFPLVVTEAIQVGLPMIGSNVGDMPTFISGNKLGFIFEKGNSSDLERKMKKMMKEGIKIRKSKIKLMKTLSNQFKLNNIVKAFLTTIS
jgi:glycosyltransferase involved in cell wall biosynthesis